VSAPPWDRFNLGGACGDDPAAVAANRTALARALGLPSEPCWLRQVHGNRVALFDAPAAAPVEADAAITRTPGVVLAILSADCLPILVAAEDGGELAAIHAGWRGIASGVIEAALGAMRTPPSRLLAWLGPGIGPDAYEVGDDVREAMLRADPAAADAFRAHGAGHWLCDLYALARMRLAACGVAHAAGGTHCTASDAARFYSSRRDGRTGRMATLIWSDAA
jgi:YfiH family protein